MRRIADRGRLPLALCAITSFLLQGFVAGVASADPPKVAVVVAGDPDAALVASGRALSDALAEREAVLLPSAPAVSALLGEREESGNGLVELRGGVQGLTASDDATALRAIGARLSADALAVLTRRDGVRLEVFDVSSGRFYEGSFAIDRSAADQGARGARYVERRAALSRSRERAQGVSPEAVARAAPPAEADPEPVSEPTFFRKNWAYFAGAALLAGVATFFIVRQVRSDDEVPPPVLRFRPGG